MPEVHEDPYPSRVAMEAAVELEIHSALGRVQTQTIGKVIQRAIDKALPTWLPIETAPKDGGHMLLACATYVDSGYWDADGWTLYPDDTRPEDHYCQRFHPEPTHWMPLPEPPVQQNGDREGDAAGSASA